MSFSNWFENILLNHIFSKGSYTPQTLYVGLCTGNPGEGATGGSCNEVSNANGYTRVQTSAGNWYAASGGEISNAAAILFPEATGTWGTITHFVLFNSGSYGAGNVLLYGVLSSPQSITKYRVPRFEAGTLGVSLD